MHSFQIKIYSAYLLPVGSCMTRVYQSGRQGDHYYPPLYYYAPMKQCSLYILAFFAILFFIVQPGPFSLSLPFFHREVSDNWWGIFWSSSFFQSKSCYMTSSWSVPKLSTISACNTCESYPGGDFPQLSQNLRTQDTIWAFRKESLYWILYCLWSLGGKFSNFWNLIWALIIFYVRLSWSTARILPKKYNPKHDQIINRWIHNRPTVKISSLVLTTDLSGNLLSVALLDLVFYFLGLCHLSHRVRTIHT